MAVKDRDFSFSLVPLSDHQSRPPLSLSLIVLTLIKLLDFLR